VTFEVFNACSTLVYQFFGGLDRRDHHLVANLMAHDGVWHRQGKELRGPSAVLTALEERDSARKTCHLVTNLYVEQDTQATARVRYYMTAYETLAAADGAASAPRMLGVRECTDDLVLEEGYWRIECKKSHLVMPAVSVAT
jgi:hypothetical protein